LVIAIVTVWTRLGEVASWFSITGAFIFIVIFWFIRLGIHIVLTQLVIVLVIILLSLWICLWKLLVSILLVRTFGLSISLWDLEFVFILLRIVCIILVLLNWFFIGLCIAHLHLSIYNRDLDYFIAFNQTIQFRIVLLLLMTFHWITMAILSIVILVRLAWTALTVLLSDRGLLVIIVGGEIEVVRIIWRLIVCRGCGLSKGWSVLVGVYLVILFIGINILWLVVKWWVRLWMSWRVLRS
jgi:hypothetical protein